MRNNDAYVFGPSMRKPTKKKDPTKLMKKSLKQLKRTREFYRASVAPKYNNDNEQGDCNVANKDTKNKIVAQKSQQTPLKDPRVVPWTISLTRSSRPNNGMSSSSKLLPKKSMPSSSKANNGVVSFWRTTNSWSYSSRQTNGIDSSHKNANGGAAPSKNGEKPRTSDTKLNNGEASHTKNTDMPRFSSLSANNDRVYPLVNIENSVILSKPYSGLVPLGKESLKSRPSRPSNEASSVLKDGSNSVFGVLKEPNHSSIFGNLRIALKNVSGEAQNKSMDGYIQLDGRKRKFGLSKDEGTNAEKSTRMKPMDCSVQLDNLKTGLVEDGGTIDGKLRKRTGALAQENPETHEDDDSEEGEDRKPTKKRRRLILNDHEDDDDDNMAGVEIDTAGLTSQTAVVKDSPIKVPNPLLSESLNQQQYGSLPIDEPVWSGLIKISSNEKVTLAAHLSTKCCEQVWKLAGSLQPEIVVTKLSRMEAWPKSFEASRPTDCNIALYFLPCQMRQDADLDQLVKEIVDNDMVLQVAIGEAEMLILPSVLLPEQHQTFQGKPYLWAVFKRRKNKVATVEAKQHGKSEDEMGKQKASHSSVDKEGHSVAGLDTHTRPEAPEEMEMRGMEQEQNPSLARTNAPSPATGDPTMDASTSSANHSSLVVPTGALFGFVVQRNPRVEQLIQEMQREGAVVVALRGEMIGSGLGQATASGREGTMQPRSS